MKKNRQILTLKKALYTQDDIDILYEQLAALEDSIQGYDQGYIDQLKVEIAFLKEQTGENYDNVDFENFGQDQIYAEIYDGVITPLEQKLACLLKNKMN